MQNKFNKQKTINSSLIDGKEISEKVDIHHPFFNERFKITEKRKKNLNNNNNNLNRFRKNNNDNTEHLLKFNNDILKIISNEWYFFPGKNFDNNEKNESAFYSSNTFNINNNKNKPNHANTLDNFWLTQNNFNNNYNNLNSNEKDKVKDKDKDKDKDNNNNKENFIKTFYQKKSSEKIFVTPVKKKSVNVFNINSKKKISLIDQNQNQNQIQNNKTDVVKNILNNKNTDYYCPICEHCNKINDVNLDKHLQLREVKEIIKKSFYFILNNFETDVNYMEYMLDNKYEKEKYNQKNNFINNNNNNINNDNHDENNFNKKNEIENNHGKERQKYSFNLDLIFKNYNISIKDKKTSKTLVRFMDALLESKIAVDYITSDETYEKLKDCLIAQGTAFSQIKGNLTFDQELDQMFDKDVKEKIRKIFESNIFILKNIKYIYIYLFTF
jgi:hypothetical protein